MCEVESLTVPQVAEALQVSERTVWRWINAGKLPSYKIGNTVRVRKSKLVEYMEAQEAERGGGNE